MNHSCPDRIYTNVLGINDAHRTQRCLDSSHSCPAPERQRVADFSTPGFKKTLVRATQYRDIEEILACRPGLT